MAEGLGRVSPQAIKPRDDYGVGFGSSLFEEPGNPATALALGQVSSAGNRTILNDIEEVELVDTELAGALLEGVQGGV